MALRGRILQSHLEFSRELICRRDAPTKLLTCVDSHFRIQLMKKTEDKKIFR